MMTVLISALVISFKGMIMMMNRAGHIPYMVVAMALVLFVFSTSVQAEEAPAPAFLAEAFNGAIPAPSVLWLTPDIKIGAKKILGHTVPGLRLRYWQDDDKTAWILNEVGKEEPITAGFVIENQAITAARVLVYRESRGWEIRYPYFRDQFINARLDDDFKLDRAIDGISGATLSVRAMQKMARFALYLDQQAHAAQ